MTVVRMLDEMTCKEYDNNNIFQEAVKLQEETDHQNLTPSSESKVNNYLS